MAKSKELSKVISGLRKFTEDQIKRVAVNGYFNISVDTPVLTGFARASWLMSVGSPATEVAGSAEKVDQNVGGSSLSSLSNWTLASGQSIFITNNVPYINRLNQGHSKQAPKGFVEKAIKETVRSVK
jgi:hypothetical protein